MFIRFLFLLVCLYFSCRFLLHMNNVLLINDIKPMSDFAVPRNKRVSHEPTTSIVSKKKITSNNSRKKKSLQSKQTSYSSYAQYKANN